VGVSFTMAVRVSFSRCNRLNASHHLAIIYLFVINL